MNHFWFLLTLLLAQSCGLIRPDPAQGASAAVTNSFRVTQSRVDHSCQTRLVDSARDAVGRNCLSAVALRFSAGVSLASLWGGVTVTWGGVRRALVLQSFSSDFTDLTFNAIEEPICDDGRGTKTLVVTPKVLSTEGEALPEALEVPIHFPTSVPCAVRPMPSRIEVVRNQLVPSPGRESSPPQLWPAVWRAGGLSGPTSAMTVTRQRYNLAVARVSQWERAEATQPFYKLKSLVLMPMEGLPYQPISTWSRRFHYGTSDLIYVLRRAATFTQALFPTMGKIGLGDLTTQNGETPSVEVGGERIFSHPEGSHRGQDADVAYLTRDGAASDSTPYDVERNFWYLYDVLSSTALDYVITAYTRELREFAARAFAEGLINETALARFESAKMMDDDGLNHDRHMHISVRNSDNMGRSRRFLGSDHVYNCYLALRRHNGGTNGNFCSSLEAVGHHPDGQG